MIKNESIYVSSGTQWFKDGTNYGAHKDDFIRWYGHTTMLGYKRSDMTAPCARVDDIAVNPNTFTQALEHFIAERAIKIVETQQKIKEKYHEKKRA